MGFNRSSRVGSPGLFFGAAIFGPLYWQKFADQYATG